MGNCGKASLTTKMHLIKFHTKQLSAPKRRRIAGIFARLTEYTTAILVFGSIVSKQINLGIIIIGLIFFFVFIVIAVIS